MHSCATSPFARVEHRVVRREPARDVVGVEDRDLGRARSPSAPIIACTSHEIGRIAAEPHGAADTGADAAPGRRGQRVVRQERREVRAHADRADARAAAAVRDAERLVQVEVRHVGAELARRASPTSALRFAPSTYTWPPCACTIAQISPCASSNTPCVDG
jgi:hypothetical protein